jgi:hypothetical protein
MLHRIVMWSGLSVGRMVDPNPSPVGVASLSWKGEVHKIRLAKESPERSGALVTDRRGRSVGQDACHQASTLRQAAVADGVHTAMNAMQSAGLNAPGHAPTADSGRFELPA